MNFKKYFAEFTGTAVLVFFGCGTASLGTYILNALNDSNLGTIVIALAFGLSLTAMCYTIGNISGCHINPAVSLAMLINGKMNVKDFIGYVIFQFAGGFAGCGLLALINQSIGFGNYGANTYGSISKLNLPFSSAIIIELILTFVFVLVVLSVTSEKKYESVSGIIAGAALTLVHIIGIPLTGTSVNPARSLAPAIFTKGEAVSQVWVFILAPLAGAALSAIVYKFIFSKKEA